MSSPGYDDDWDNHAYEADDAKVEAYRRLIAGEQGLLDDPEEFDEDPEFEGFSEKDF